jgi:hypothetical protein
MSLEKEIKNAALTRNVLLMAQLEEAGNVLQGATDEVAQSLLEDPNIGHAIEFMSDNPGWLKKMKQKLKINLMCIKEHEKRLKQIEKSNKGKKRKKKLAKA